MTKLHPDCLALFESLLSARVELVLIGGIALGVHDPDRRCRPVAEAET